MFGTNKEKRLANKSKRAKQKELKRQEKELEKAARQAEKEKLENVSDICRNCKYFGHCLTEHYRYVKDLDNSCNGYKGLLDWYEAGL